MRAKAYDCFSVRDCAELARGTSHVVFRLGWTYDYLMAFWSEGQTRRVLGDDDDDGSNRQSFQFVGMRGIIGREIDGETVAVSGSNCHGIVRGHWLVSVGEASLTMVCLNKRVELRSIDCFTGAWKITRLIVAPYLSLGKRAYFREETVKVRSIGIASV